MSPGKLKLKKDRSVHIRLAMYQSFNTIWTRVDFVLGDGEWSPEFLTKVLESAIRVTRTRRARIVNKYKECTALHS